MSEQTKDAAHDHHSMLLSQGFPSFPTTTTTHDHHLINYSHYPPFMMYHDLQNPTTHQFHHTHHHHNPPHDHDLCSLFLQASADYITTAPSTPFHLSSNNCSSSEVAVCNNNKNWNDSNSHEVVIRDIAAENPPTPNSWRSFSSPEAGSVDEDSSCKGKKDLQLEVCEGGDIGKSKKLKAGKTKEEENKKQREARFAFMTKSEVDNLEDGYRWRKYGQKAVKNSAFPRSYYRCTSQKCSVKKRIERSHEDPSVVITTYEGQHNHHSPATIRGGAAAAFLAPSLFSPPPPAFPILPQVDIFSPSTAAQQYSQQQQPQLPDHHHYSLFPDMLSSFLQNPHDP
ncbi:WRKY transcription factor 28 [Sesamum angolense]|uniref:WRKY transcription factor 28 n=1 Tax=Sesamum angolense TaxID=2727404 RepID=A0AAE2BUL8_9LAMI|nr:WRKY transcription factor 28 [Sesamum angolense]